MKKEMESNVPLDRLGDPDDIAKAISFLASDEASYVSATSCFAVNKNASRYEESVLVTNASQKSAPVASSQRKFPTGCSRY